MARSFTRREMLRNLGVGGTAAGVTLLTRQTRADMVSDGDTEFYARYAKNIQYLTPAPRSAPSACLSNGKVIQPQREIPIFHTADVVVVGGGSAGFAAAVAAARSGAKVAMIERYGSLGGLFTNGIVLIVIGTGVKENGEFKLVTRGICEELLRRLGKMGDQAITPMPPEIGQPTADPEATKVLMDEMVQEAGVDMFFHAWGVDVIQEGNGLKGVVFESKQGRQAILAKVVVDASGDGDVFAQAGAEFRQISHSMGFVYRIGNVDRVDSSKLPAGVKPPRLGSIEPLKASVWKNNLGFKGNGVDIRELSKFEMEHRKQAWESVQKLRQLPGYEDIYLAQTTSQIGVRASRLLDGVATVDKQSAITRRKFKDSVAVSGHEGLKLPEFQIPYGALLPKVVDNLLVAGRCISCAPNLIDRVRLIPVCIVTGEAAGVAAALAAKNNTRPRDVPVADIQKILVERGAYLG